MEKKVLTNEERIANNRAIAESYYHAYDKKAVKDGAVYALHPMRNTGRPTSATA